jgi:hypothetical protein
MSDPILAFHCGQSNTRCVPGQTNGNHALPDMRYYNNREQVLGSRFLDPKYGRYPLDRTDSRDRFSVPMSVSFARRVLALTGREVWSLTVARGGHPIESFMRLKVLRANGWTRPADMTNQAPFIHGQFEDALDAAPHKPEFFDVVCYHQGEANGPQAAPIYKAKLKALHADLTEGGLIGPSTKFICGGLLPVANYYATHKAACLAAVAELPNAYFVDSSGLNGLPDNLHFDGIGLEEMGRRYANAFIAAP